MLIFFLSFSIYSIGKWVRSFYLFASIEFFVGHENDPSYLKSFYFWFYIGVFFFFFANSLNWYFFWFHPSIFEDFFKTIYKIKFLFQFHPPLFFYFMFQIYSLFFWLRVWHLSPGLESSSMYAWFIYLFILTYFISISSFIIYVIND
jgi:hypothetical protein